MQWCVSPATASRRACALKGEDNPIPAQFRADHEAYVAALRATGAEVVVAPPLEDYPDSVFVEDPALCLMGKAIILRPGAETRFGERDAAREVLTGVLGAENIIELPEGGIVDGGDILVTKTEVLVGLSARTDHAGVELLRPIIEKLGLELKILQTPAAHPSLQDRLCHSGRSDHLCGAGSG